MSIGVAATLEPLARPSINKADLTRLELLGDNCELGFVLRRLGFDDGMLFRWASIKPASLLATFRGNFEHLYDFDNLIPAQPGMVRDLHYGTAWHTQMYSTRREGTLIFNDDTETRRGTHARESSKLAYLLEKLRRKFNHPNPVFVIKSNGGIDEDVLEAIHYQLYRCVTSSRFLLLEVQENAARAGSVELVDRNRMRGYISRLAPYTNSEDGDDACWISLLKQALAHNAEAPAEATSTLAPPLVPTVVLPFPDGAGPDLRAPVPGDLRGGMPSRIGGNAWCRMVDEETYRMHAGLTSSPTTLRWTGVNLPQSSLLTVGAWCAIAESLPVRATLEVVGADGTALRSQHIFDRVVEQNFSLLVPPRLANPLTVSLYAEPLAPLKEGERAVIDIDPIKAIPPRI